MSLQFIQLAPREAVSLIGTDGSPAGPITATIQSKSAAQIQINTGDSTKFIPITITTEQPNYQFQPQYIRAGVTNIVNVSTSTTVYLAVQGKVQGQGSTESVEGKRKAPTKPVNAEDDDAVSPAAEKRAKTNAAAAKATAASEKLEKLPTTKVPEEKKAPKAPTVMKLPNGLQYHDQEGGRGPAVGKGATVGIRYQGLFTDGQVFDTNMPKGQLLTFTVGRGEVVSGMDQGMLGMQIGGKRRMILPPQLAYGRAGSPPQIPPNAMLIFDVELVKMTK